MNSLELGFNPDQARDGHGMWTEHGGAKLTLKSGVHIEKFGGDAHPQHIKSVARVLHDKGVFNYLAKHPVGRMEIVHQVTKEPDGAPSNSSGMYTIRENGTSKIQVKIPRKEGASGKEFKPGEIFSMSMAGKDNLEASARTMLHELTHHALAHEAAKNREIEGLVDQTFQNRKQPTFTKYAGKNAHEFLSESVVAYHFHPEELKAYDPKAYALAHEFTVRSRFGKPNSHTKKEEIAMKGQIP